MAAKKRPNRKAASKRTRRGRGRAKSSRRPAVARRPKSPRAARPRRHAKRTPTARKPARRSSKPASPKSTRPPRQKPSERRAAASPATLGRERRRLSDSERLEKAAFSDDRLIASARAGHDDLKAQLDKHTETSPALAGGDIDAKWQDAYAVGDEAPGGDNPTPGQDRVDDIGKALGVNYRRDEELQGGDEIAKRDKHRWELDPASSDDWPHSEKE